MGQPPPLGRTKTLSLSFDGEQTSSRVTPQRHSKTSVQLEKLETSYAVNVYPSREVLTQLSQSLGLTHKVATMMGEPSIEGSEDRRLSCFASLSSSPAGDR